MINRQRGVALLMVLFILALMMILASAMTERTAVMYQHTAVTLDNLQARWYALAAENMAAALLQRDGLLILLGYLFLLATIIYFGALAWAALATGQGIMSLFR